MSRKKSPRSSMSKKSATSARNREKGHDYERSVAQIFRVAFPHRAEEIERTIQTRGAIKEGSDFRFPNLWPECQDSADPTPYVKLDQAETEMRAKGVPCLPAAIVHKKRARVSYVYLRAKAWAWLVHNIVRPGPPHEGDETILALTLDDFVRACVEYQLDRRVPPLF